MQKYLIKFAWKCNHEVYGDITSFIVTPYQETSPCSWGYVLDESEDEVIRFPSSSPLAIQILHKMAPIGNNQWSMPSYGNLIENEFNLDDFREDYFYQDNYGRDVVFYTHYDCE